MCIHVTLEIAHHRPAPGHEEEYNQSIQSTHQQQSDGPRSIADDDAMSIHHGRVTAPGVNLFNLFHNVHIYSGRK